MKQVKRIEVQLAGDVSRRWARPVHRSMRTATIGHHVAVRCRSLPFTANLHKSMSNSLAIQADSLCKTYKEGLLFRKQFQALKNVSFQVQKGEAFGLLGPNGAGKTTFIKILLGVIGKSKGAASMLGFPAGSQKGRELVGYLPEHLRVPSHMTGYTALECFGNLSNIPNRIIREKRDELLSLVGLEGRGNDRVAKYSKGMVQRLGLAQSLLNDPQLLILDEPTDGLDPRARAEVRNIIQRLTDKGVTIFLNSHLLREVEVTCSRVAILNRGELKYVGAVDEIGKFIKEMEPESSGGVIVQIKGDPNAVNASMAGSSFEIIEKQDQDQFVVRVAISEQPDVDRLVDSIRQNGVSLFGLEKQKVTLEDAFLKIVDEPEEG